MLSIAERIENIASRKAAEQGCELVHVDLLGTKRNQVVRIYIDKPDGVSIDDCSNFSHAVEAVLDEDDFIPAAYVLEVSSPGIERELYSIADFERFAGRLAKVKTKMAIDGQKTFTGVITRVENERISFDDRARGSIEFSFTDVAKANLKIDLAEEFKKRRPAEVLG